jgi:hypothetical protein
VILFAAVIVAVIIVVAVAAMVIAIIVVARGFITVAAVIVVDIMIRSGRATGGPLASVGARAGACARCGAIPGSPR